MPGCPLGALSSRRIGIIGGAPWAIQRWGRTASLTSGHGTLVKFSCTWKLQEGVCIGGSIGRLDAAVRCAVRTWGLRLRGPAPHASGGYSAYSYGGGVWCLPMQVGMGQAGALEPAPWHFPCMTAPSRKKRARGGQAGITRSASPCLYVFVVPSYIFL